ncbi:hypothetical protein [Salinigranum halophilum]|uniref:hypothetical protein n=1 Tax=Salinigranum halophilum TaxID=2565931 RepID=UPI0010A8F566|nr:hypothetical protein [Salinigranum halophilum]
MRRIDAALRIIDFETVVYEEAKKELPERNQDEDAIIRIMEGCDACFIFPTLTAQDQDKTPEWLIAESTIARVVKIPSVIFQEQGVEQNISFPFFDALVVYDEADLPIKLQERMKAFADRRNWDERDTCQKMAQALFANAHGLSIDNFIIDPLVAEYEDKTGIVEGGSLIKCVSPCDKKFLYWGENDAFTCPHCHSKLHENTNRISGIFEEWP